MRGANRNPDYQRRGAMAYELNNGNRFVLHRGNQLSELVFLEGAYEPLETMIVSQAVRSGDVVLDVGANVGYYTSLLDRLVAPGGQVHSFEPGLGTFSGLETTKQLLGLDHTSLHQKAISDQVGSIDFYVSTSGSDAQQSTVKVAALGKETRLHRVEASTIDAFVAGLKARPGVAFVKCDIEGAELLMLKGAQGLLNSENPPLWLIEHNRPALIEHQASSADLLAPFTNFEVYYVPLCWPPSMMASPKADQWNGVPAALPDECNLIIFPKHGAFANRAASLRQSGLIP
jgi:FkbM family methyltransferase